MTLYQISFTYRADAAVLRTRISELRAAARAAHCEEFVGRLPEGWGTGYTQTAYDVIAQRDAEQAQSLPQAERERLERGEVAFHPAARDILL